MTSRLRKLVCAAVLATTAPLPFAAASSASYFDYAAWAELPEIARAMYISGAFNSFVIYTGSSSLLPRHYTGCLYELKLNGDQLADNLFDYVQSKPQLRNGSVQVALEQYLADTCGAPAAVSASDAAFQTAAPKNLMEIPRREIKGDVGRKGK